MDIFNNFANAAVGTYVIYYFQFELFVQDFLNECLNLLLKAVQQSLNITTIFCSVYAQQS